jgi:hypothetical protein
MPYAMLEQAESVYPQSHIKLHKTDQIHIWDGKESGDGKRCLQQER